MGGGGEGGVSGVEGDICGIFLWTDRHIYRVSLFNIVYKRNRYIFCTQIWYIIIHRGPVHIAVQSETGLTTILTLFKKGGNKYLQRNE